MSEHTKEPWALDDTDDGLVLEGHERGPMDEEYICLLTDISKSDARRIVACVNACAGMGDPAEGIKQGRDLAKKSYEAACTLKAQRDELLAAAKEVQALYIDSVFGFGGHSEEAMKILSAAIANAEKDKSGC